MSLIPLPRAHAFALLLALGAAAPTTTGAQEPPAGSFGERVEVEVVEIDVVVTDRDGDPIVDLPREAFEVAIDGRPVEVDYFAAPAAAKPAKSAPEAETEEPSILWSGEVEGLPGDLVPAAESSTLVVYVDQAALRAGDRNRAVDEIREFLARRPEGEEVSIAAFEHRLRMLAEPTTDPAAIERALDAILELPVAGELAWGEGRELNHRIRGIQVGWFRTAGPDDGEESGVGETEGRRAERQRMAESWDQHGNVLESEVRQWADFETERVRRSVAALGQLVGSLAALDGRKAVVLVTGGATTESGEAMLALLGVQRGNEALNRMTPRHEAKQRLREEFERTVRAAQDARVAFYTVSGADPSSLQDGVDLASPGRDTLAGQRRDPAIADAAASVQRMARATGGAQLLLGSDLDTRLEQVRREGESAYSLGVDVGPELGRGDHRIEVRLRDGRRGLTVRHRESFRRTTAAEAAEQSLYAAATLARTENAMGIEVETGAARPSGDDPDERLLPVALRIPLRSILLDDRGDGVRRGRLSFRVALAVGDGELHVAEAQPIPIEVPERDLERALDGVWVHRAEVRLAPATRRVALLVEDELTGISATVAVPLAQQDGGSSSS
jgi:VWFA-related protein